jgi:hypothetical protein
MTDNTEARHPDTQGHSAHGLYIACGLLMVVILLLDLSIPLGVAMGVPYIAVVLISLWSPHKKFTILVAALSSVLTIVAFLYKPAVPEMWKVIFNRSLALFAIWVTASLGLQRTIIEEKREIALRERERALEDIRILRGLLPICASCKMIRDDQGYWTQIEGYIRTHSEADFTHGICPGCARKLYPELYKETDGESDIDT